MQYEGPVIVDAKLYKLYGPRKTYFNKPSAPVRPKSEWFEVVAPTFGVDSIDR